MVVVVLPPPKKPNPYNKKMRERKAPFVFAFHFWGLCPLWTPLMAERNAALSHLMGLLGVKRWTVHIVCQVWKPRFSPSTGLQVTVSLRHWKGRRNHFILSITSEMWFDIFPAIRISHSLYKLLNGPLPEVCMYTNGRYFFT